MHISDIVFCAALAFLIGVAAASFGLSGVIIISAASSAGILLKILFRQFSFKQIIVFSVAVFLGAFYYNFYLNLRDARTNIVLNQEITFSGVVTNEPKGFEKYQILTFELREPYSGEITLFAPPLQDLRYGDLLKINGAVEPQREKAELRATFFPKIEIISRHNGFWPKEKLLDFKHLLLEQFDKSLSAEESALLGGITFGSRSGFSDKMRQIMAASGTTHLVALSGYNITILVTAIGTVFGMFLSRRRTFYISTAFIVFFVLMVGGEPSVIRAAIMGFLALFAKEIGRIYSVRTAIAFAACFMVLFNSTILVHDVGFQLSFVSLLGIVYLAPAVKNIFKIKDEGVFGWKENAALTASAQLAVLPIIATTFGEFSLASFLANILILCFVPFMMFLGFLLAGLSAVYYYLGFFVAKLAALLLSYSIWIMEVFADFRITFEFPAPAAYFFIAIYYTAMVIIVHAFKPKPE